jgi:uncharacterized membrane protein
MPAKTVTRMHYVILLVLSLIPLVITMIALQFLPDQIPGHYNIDGEITRWGSKYESLFLPVMAAAIGLFMIWTTKFSAEKDDYAGKLVFYVAAGTSLAMTILTVILLYMSFSHV